MLKCAINQNFSFGTINLTAPFNYSYKTKRSGANKSDSKNIANAKFLGNMHGEAKMGI